MLEKIKEIIAEQLSIDAGHMDADDHVYELCSDEYDIVNIVMAIKDEFEF